MITELKEEVEPQDGPVDNTFPVYSEKYNDELRETYAPNRIDKMHFRMVDPQSYETRLFSKGRPDDARECTTYLLDSRNRTVVFGGNREDGCVEYKRMCSVVVKKTREEEEGAGGPQQDTLMYSMKFENRCDGIKRIALSLRADTEIDFGLDTPPILFRDKIWHVAVVTDPQSEAWGPIAESVFEMPARTLRILVEDAAGNQKQKHFSCLVPTNDEHYERARLSIMDAVSIFMQIERELFFHLPLFVPGTSEANATTIQKQRLEDTVTRMMKSFDGLTATTVDPWPVPAVVSGSPLSRSPERGSA